MTVPVGRTVAHGRDGNKIDHLVRVGKFAMTVACVRYNYRIQWSPQYGVRSELILQADGF
jgi:hypothetical protein